MFFVSAVIATVYIGVIFTYTFSWHKALRKPGPSSDFSPKVSVIVAAKDEEQHITSLLDCLYRQTSDRHSFEVILVDDHSEDSTRLLAEQWRLTHQDFPLHIFVSPNGQNGKKNALQYAVDHASGELIAATDADCLPPPQWIASTRNAFSDSKRHICCGLTSYTAETTLFHRLQSLEFLSLVACGMASVALRRPIMCNGSNLVYRRNSFLAVGGYETNLSTASGDDIFLMLKMREKFGKSAIGLCLSNNSVVQTHPANTLREFLSQRLRWAGKTPRMHSGDIYFVALAVFLMSLCLCAVSIGYVFSASFFPSFALAWSVKFIVDYPIIHSVTGLVKKKHLRKYYFPLQIIYPFYIVAVATISLLVRPSWKQRKI